MQQGGGQQGKDQFIGSLEGMRGIAALFVAVFHCISPIRINGEVIFHRTIWELHGWDEFSLRLSAAVFSGAAPVAIFFVLSGFVLYRSLDDSRQAPFRQTIEFSVSRFLRIYPTLALNLVCMWTILTIFASVQGFFPSWHVVPTSIRDLWTNLLLLEPSVNGASWTLRIEIVAIPFILFGYFTMKFGMAAQISLIVASCGVMLWLPARGDSMWEFIFLFYLGMGAAELLKYQPVVYNSWALATAMLLIALSRAVLGYNAKSAILIEGLACTYAIAAVAAKAGPIDVFLNSRAVRFCGRISYSFYLYHPLLMPLIGFGIVYRIVPGGDLVTGPLVVILSIISTIPVAWVSYRFVEIPTSRLLKSPSSGLERFRTLARGSYREN